MFDTMACSSKLVDPMMMVGLLAELLTEAPADRVGMTSVAAMAARTPEARERLNRMAISFRIGEAPMCLGVSQWNRNQTVD